MEKALGHFSPAGGLNPLIKRLRQATSASTYKKIWPLHAVSELGPLPGVFVHTETENAHWILQTPWPLTSNQNPVTGVTLAPTQAPDSSLAANPAGHSHSAFSWQLTRVRLGMLRVSLWASQVALAENSACQCRWDLRDPGSIPGTPNTTPGTLYSLKPSAYSHQTCSVPLLKCLYNFEWWKQKMFLKNLTASLIWGQWNYSVWYDSGAHMLLIHLSNP